MGRHKDGAVLVAACTAALLATTGIAAAPVSPPAPASATCTTAGVVDTWSLRKLARQTVVVPVDETDVNAVSPEVAAGVGGVILFGSSAPFDLGSDLAHLLAQAPDGIPPVVMTDEEGGAVQRMANLVGSMPSARAMAQTMTRKQVRRLARRVGAKMYAAHVTMNLAPVLDLDDRPGPSASNPDGTRSFSVDPDVAGAYGLAFARGMRRAGVVPVVKHFPGLGHATANTDVEPAWTLPWSTLQHAGLLPFRSAVDAGLPAVMVANARVPGLTRKPATLSSRVVRNVLRRQLRFDGLVMTDALSAGAISGAGYPVWRAAVRALEVGEDMVLFTADKDDVASITGRVVHAIVRAARHGRLPTGRLRAAAVHVLTAKGADVCRRSVTSPRRRPPQRATTPREPGFPATGTWGCPSRWPPARH